MCVSERSKSLIPGRLPQMLGMAASPPFRGRPIMAGSMAQRQPARHEILQKSPSLLSKSTRGPVRSFIYSMHVHNFCTADPVVFGSTVCEIIIFAPRKSRRFCKKPPADLFCKNVLPPFTPSAVRNSAPFSSVFSPISSFSVHICHRRCSQLPPLGSSCLLSPHSGQSPIFPTPLPLLSPPAAAAAAFLPLPPARPSSHPKRIPASFQTLELPLFQLNRRRSDHHGQGEEEEEVTRGGGPSAPTTSASSQILHQQRRLWVKDWSRAWWGIAAVPTSRRPISCATTHLRASTPQPPSAAPPTGDCRFAVAAARG